MASPGLDEAVLPDRILETFLGRLRGKQGWSRVEPLKVKEAILEVSSNDSVPAWRGTVKITGKPSSRDVVIVCKYLLGEDRYLRSSPCRNTFTGRFDFHQGGNEHGKRRSGPFPVSAIGSLDSQLGASPSSSPPSPRSGLALGSILSNLAKEVHGMSPSAPLRSPSNRPPLQRGIWRSQTDLSASEEDEDGQTDGEDDDKQTITTDGDDRSTGERVSLTRRLTRLATSGIRRVSAVRLSGGLSSGEGAQDERPDTPLTRKLRFTRYEFNHAIVCVDDDGTLDSSNLDEDPYHHGTHEKRVKLNVMGAAVIPLVGLTGSDEVQVTFILDMNPVVEDWEIGLFKESSLSEMCGQLHVETFLQSVQEACQMLRNEEARELLLLRDDWTGDGLFGRIKWGTYNGRDSIIVGSQVKHQQHGSGHVESFDMRGTFKVKYDGAQNSMNHQLDEREKFRLMLRIGDRVRHRTKGLGTVQSTMLDSLLIRYDSGSLRRYPKDGWQRKLRRVNEEDEGLIRFSASPHAEVREGVARVQFVVPDATPEMILGHILRKGSFISAEERDEVQERKVLKVIHERSRVLWEQRVMPKPLAPRSFVSRETWGPVLRAIVVHITHTNEEEVPENGGLVRGQKVYDGWVIEPIPMVAGCFITHVLCLDLAGFVPPEAVRCVRDGLLTSEALNMIHECKKVSQQGSPTTGHTQSSSAGVQQHQG